MTYTDDEIRNQVPERPVREPRTSRPRADFRGNSYDLTALAALGIGLVVLLMCVTFGQFVYCLPFIAIVLGIIGLVLGRDAVDPQRTRLWSWLGIGGAGVSLLVGILLVFSYFACFFVMMLFSWRGY